MGFIGKIIVSTNKTEGLQACIKITLGGGKVHRQWRRLLSPVAVSFTVGGSEASLPLRIRMYPLSEFAFFWIDALVCASCYYIIQVKAGLCYVLTFFKNFAT